MEVLQADLKIKQKEVSAEKTEVEAMIADIKQKSEIASKHQSNAEKKKAQMDIDVIKIAEEKKIADEMWSAAIPLLNEALELLKSIKVEDLTNIKALANPPDPIKVIGNILVMLKPLPENNPSESDGWNGVRQMMNNPSSFVNFLKDYGTTRLRYLTKKQVEKIKSYMQKEKQYCEKERMQKASQAAYALFQWVDYTLKLFVV